MTRFSLARLQTKAPSIGLLGSVDDQASPALKLGFVPSDVLEVGVQNEHPQSGD